MKWQMNGLRMFMGMGTKDRTLMKDRNVQKTTPDRRFYVNWSDEEEQENERSVLSFLFSYLRYAPDDNDNDDKGPFSPF